MDTGLSTEATVDDAKKVVDDMKKVKSAML
jgi:hypothetical protein